MNNVIDFPPPPEEPHCYSALDEVVELDPVEQVAQMMGLTNREVSDIMQVIQTCNYWLSGTLEDGYREGKLVDMSVYEVDLSRPIQTILNDLYVSAFSSLEEARDSLNGGVLNGGAVIDPADETRVVFVNDSTIVLTEWCDGKVVFNREALPVIMTFLAKARRARRDSDFSPSGSFLRSNLDRVKALTGKIYGSSKLMNYFIDSSNVADVLDRFSHLAPFLTCPNPSFCVSDERRVEVKAKEDELRGGPTNFDNAIWGSQYGEQIARRVNPMICRANDIAELRREALIYRKIMKEDPINLMKAVFMIGLIEFLEANEIEIPFEYAKLVDPEMRRRVRAMEGEVYENRDEYLDRLLGEMLEDRIGDTVDLLTREIDGLEADLEQQGVDAQIAERLIDTETNFMIERRRREAEDINAKREAQVRAFMDACPDPRMFVDEIMGVKNGVLPV